jgi:predicted RNA-binding protein
LANKWIVTISQDNLQETLKHKLIGLPEARRKVAKRIQPGDTVILYIGKKRAGQGGPRASVSEFGPVVKVTGEEFFSDTPIWKSKSGERFPSRLPISIVSQGRVKAPDVISRLKFPQGKQKWGLYFLTGVRELSEEDYKTILAAIRK